MNRVLNSLPVFVSAVEMKSMTKAAAAHNMSQSMATRHIQLIERELNGVQLLQRSRTGVTLTPKGLVFYTAIRSEERRGGKECVSMCSSRWSASHIEKNLLSHTLHDYTISTLLQTLNKH